MVRVCICQRTFVRHEVSGRYKLYRICARPFSVSAHYITRSASVYLFLNIDTPILWSEWIDLQEFKLRRRVIANCTSDPTQGRHFMNGRYTLSAEADRLERICISSEGSSVCFMLSFNQFSEPKITKTLLIPILILILQQSLCHFHPSPKSITTTPTLR